MSIDFLNDVPCLCTICSFFRVNVFSAGVGMFAGVAGFPSNLHQQTQYQTSRLEDTPEK
jgi:hypothetical protein